MNDEEIICNAFYAAGIIRPGMRPSEDARKYAEMQLKALRDTLHLELAQRLMPIYGRKAS